MENYIILDNIGYGSNGNNVVKVKNLTDNKVSYLLTLLSRFMQWRRSIWTTRKSTKIK